MKRLFYWVLTSMLLLLAACVQPSAAPPVNPVDVTQSFTAATPIFINEIHYDNASSDVGEAVEVAAPAGTDLANWSLVLYNGSATQLSVYNTVTLSGVVVDQNNGYGTLSFPISGIQNGGPDGLALVNPAGTVIQFLSYEGSFTAANGPAVGLTSTDIAVSETGSTPVGNSLQLMGTGTVYSAFSWAAPAVASFGSVNAAQSFGGEVPVATNVLINEVDADQASTDSAEFIELYDGGVGNTSLNGLVLVFFNGNSDSSYRVYDLDGQATNAMGYFVLCGDATTVANCDLDVSPNTNLIQNGADAVALYQDDDSSFPNGTAVTTTNLLDALVYDTNDADDASLLVLLEAGQAQINENENGKASSESNQRCPDGAGGARNTTGYTQAEPTAGTENCPAPVGAGLKKIHEIQGNGSSSPLVGSLVEIEAVVTADFQSNTSSDSGDLRGFYVQEEVTDVDADASTSEGLFVFEGNSSLVDVSVGDVVQLTGTVSEFESSGGASSLTQLINPTVQVVGTASVPAPVALSLPVSAQSDFEAVEGMRVSFAQELIISEYFNYDRFGELVLAAPIAPLSRPFQPTSYLSPGSVVDQTSDLISRSRITLDDGSSAQNPSTNRHPNGSEFTLTNRFRGGDALTNVVGVIDDTFGIYRLQPTQGASYSVKNPRTAQPDAVGGNLKVASLNVLNFFLTLDDGVNDVCGANQSLECRGADETLEFQRQQSKIIKAIKGLNADVVGLIELENTPNVDPLANLVTALNNALGAGTYAAIDTGVIGTDAIKVGLLYKPAKVSPAGAFAVLDDAAFINPFNASTPKNRPALAQSFSQTSDGATFTVVVNHLKSKGSSCGVGDDDPQQGNCNGTRTAAVNALVDWLATDPTNSGDSDVLIIGDLNAYDKEDPITALANAGYTDLSKALQGEFAYSYLFGGQYGYLDYALASSSLFEQVTGVTEWHINADEPDILDYDVSFKSDTQDALFENNAFRASDHDPVLVGLNLTPSVEVSFKKKGEWYDNNGTQYGFIGEITITNPTNNVINPWQVSFTMPSTLINLWSGDVARNGDDFVVSAKSWNKRIQPGKSVSFGFQISHSSFIEAPTNLNFTGAFE